ncbi:MAG: prolipoprotein diacylglyceryl transferase [Phycisphaeraceae bacterium]|nr:prolipoprotein diacylglyceryl transferase [Phycisphaeraceae bacterium]
MIASSSHIFWSPGYGMMLVVGFVVGGLLWIKRMNGRPELTVALAGGVVGLVVGAKLGYLFAEGPAIWNRGTFWQQLLVGKTVTGALLGGYAGVEIGKKIIGYHQPTGDTFALAVPAGLILGRIGCLMHGCCKGVACEPAWWASADATGSYYPAAITELLFNVIALTVSAIMVRKRLQPGQLFHLYLIAYGMFRFVHEFIRDTPTLIAGLTGYQLLAIAMIALGFIRYAQRAAAPTTPKTPPAA